jgi:capsular polysaccharide biosynthesis protein
MLGVAIAFGLEFFNNALRTRQDVEYYLGLPVLAAVPELSPQPLMLEYDREAAL